MSHGHDGNEAHDRHADVGSGREGGHYARRIRAMEALLVEKGVLTREDVRRQLDYMEARSPENGARLVARAWEDPAFKQRLLSDTKSAAAEMDIDASGPVEFVVLENTDDTHHLVVCTLCSCYPRAILGRPPDWYKSFNYRSRAVYEPRSVLREFGLRLGDDVKVAVHDSTADVRYMVLPQRPPGTNHLDEEMLAGLVTRDSLVGASVPRHEPGVSG